MMDLPQGRRPHPDRQQCDCLVDDIPSLLQYLRDKGQDNRGLEVQECKTWFPPPESSPDSVAFWTPSSSSSYDSLSYSQLDREISNCPAYSGGVRVAIVLPGDEMAHTATAILATMAQTNVTAVPLGPKILWDAMQQLNCQVLLLSSTILMDKDCCFILQENALALSSNHIQEKDLSFVLQTIQEVRIVEPGVCGRLEWNVYQKVPEESIWSRVTVVDNTLPIPVEADPSSPALLLRTSGTTAQPKVVPITRSHLFFAAKMIATTLQLQPHDCCVNAMPLFHIGGIACNLLAVLMSGGSVVLQGPFHDPLAFWGHIAAFQRQQPTAAPVPVATWYYATPSMHKAIALVAPTQPCRTNRLRFVRSASAHLPHDLAMELSRLLNCGVIPTYGMSEAMPICSSAPLVHHDNDDSVVVDSVGYPTGTSVQVVHPETHSVLPYGEIGEICVRGGGVIAGYENVDPATGFTAHGWLLTGDLGQLDSTGRLFIKGRSKEMIKRGGEQIWPNQVDDIVQSVPGVAAAVTFGVPNPLLGEEVATAVVPLPGVDPETLRRTILQTCKDRLEANAIPRQIQFLPSTDCLLKGPTGKYLRSKMADHLGLEAADTGAWKLLESVTALRSLPTSTVADQDDPNGCEGDETVPMEKKSNQAPLQLRVIPHDCLNGVRFLVACMVVHTHVGLFPNSAWIKLQSYTPNMLIFFALGVFQTTCSVARPVKGQWATWVGTKIGTLHALFVISQLFTLPSYVVWSCTDENGDFVCDAYDYISIFLRFTIGTTTGLIHGLDVNYFAWFQSTFYLFLILFPFADAFLRCRSLVPTLVVILVASLSITVSCYVLAGLILPNDIFVDYFWYAQYSIVSWAPFIVACMCSAYFFQAVACGRARKGARKETLLDPTLSADDSVECSWSGSGDPDTIDIESVKASTKRWGHVCDICSLLLLGIWIAVGAYPDTICLKPDTFEAMRGYEELQLAEECRRPGVYGYYHAEEVTYQEFMEYVHPDIEYLARWETTFSLAFGYWKMAAPLYLLWVFAMAFGHGMTARFFGHWILTSLAPLGYPTYLLHNAVARYYWLATRGLESQIWWSEAGVYPFPVGWYEYFIILAISIALGHAANRWMVPILMPRTISCGVSVCTFLSDSIARCISFIRRGRTGHDTDEDSEIEPAAKFDQIKSMVLSLTGVNVTHSTELRTLGMDSLGTTALLGMLRASVPAAKSLTLRQLQSCETVGDLANVLDDQEALRGQYTL